MPRDPKGNVSKCTRAPASIIRLAERRYGCPRVSGDGGAGFPDGRPAPLLAAGPARGGAAERPRAETGHTGGAGRSRGGKRKGYPVTAVGLERHACGQLHYPRVPQGGDLGEL